MREPDRPNITSRADVNVRFDPRNDRVELHRDEDDPAFVGRNSLPPRRGQPLIPPRHSKVLRNPEKRRGSS